jgi:hypothetical protein
MNLQTLLRCSGKYGIYFNCDGTYKLTNNDWVLLNLITETIIDSHGGKFHSRTCLNDSVDYSEYHVDLSEYHFNSAEYHDDSSESEYHFNSSEYHFCWQNILHPESQFR